LKNHFYLSEQELNVWRRLSNLYIQDGGYNYLLSHGPFAFNNLIGIVIKFIPDPSFILPHLIALCFFILAINIQLDKASDRQDPIIKPLMLFLLLCLTPSSLLVLLNRPVEIVLAVAIWTLNRGVMEANSKSLGRGIFITSTACTFIILMGPSGVSYLMAFISLLPLFLKQKIIMMREIVSRLKPHYRTLIELRYFDELSYEEIAQELNLPLGTVKAKLFRARDLLYNIFKESEDKI
jgi:hypothetical protein